MAEAYGEFIAILRELHDTIEALREWIGTHDAVLQPATGAVYSSADDLFAALLPRQWRTASSSPGLPTLSASLQTCAVI